MSDNLTREEVRDIAKIEVRAYFDLYLNEVHPSQQKEIYKNMAMMLKLHDHDDSSHGGVRRKFDRAYWMVIGASSLIGCVYAVVSTLLRGL